MSERLLEVEHVTKTYRLGMIGGGTLHGDLTSWWARVRGKEDPNLKIGMEHKAKNAYFNAVEDVSFNVDQGDAVALVGRNGAGKSTILKLISRITAPTDGEIRIRGRVASLLEIGTGFHPELSGRDNIYLNGAILGMTRQEIDRKLEDIIDFSEVREFIDTPVKRYSSGMYVKLAFSVAAHLDSEIMIMDEVLAVGDMAFQKKCLDKMRDAAKKEGRTVLYVSHNMNTIRQLCDRCIVLDKGKVVFEGDVEKAIDVYMGRQMNESTYRNYEEFVRPKWIRSPKIKILEAEYLKKDNVHFDGYEPIHLRMKFEILHDIQNVGLRIEVISLEDVPLGTYCLYDFCSGYAGQVLEFEMDLDASMFMDAEYKTYYTLFHKNAQGGNADLDWVPGLCFQRTTVSMTHNWVWRPKVWGFIQLPEPHINSQR